MALDFKMALSLTLDYMILLSRMEYFLALIDTVLMEELGVIISGLKMFILSLKFLVMRLFD